MLKFTQCEALNNASKNDESYNGSRNNVQISQFLKSLNFDFKLSGDERLNSKLTSKTKLLLDQPVVSSDDRLCDSHIGTFGVVKFFRRPISGGFSISSDKNSLYKFQSYQSSNVINNRSSNIKNLLQFCSSSCHDFISPGYTMRNSQLIKSSLRTLVSVNWTKLSLIHQIVSGMKLHSIQFVNVQSIDQNIQSTLFAWLTTYVDDRFTSYPDEYIFDILVIVFMEHQGIISIKEFDVLLWTLVSVNENLVRKDYKYHRNNPRAEKIALVHAQVHREMLEISNKNYGQNIAVVERLRMRNSKNISMASFNEHYFIHQHSFYASRQTRCFEDQTHCTHRDEDRDQNIFNILEDKLNLNLFNKMKLNEPEYLLTQPAHLNSSSISGSKFKIKKLRLWMKNIISKFKE